VSRVLLLSPAALGPRMSGPAVRFYELAKALAEAGQEPLLASPEKVDPGFASSLPFEAATYNRRSLPAQLAWSEVVVIQGWLLWNHPQVAKAGRPIVADLYDPIFFETLSQYDPADYYERIRHNVLLGVVSRTVETGDFFICASDKQRDLWLGFMAACNRINPATYRDDPEFKRLLSVVPFGLPDQPPQKSGPGLRALPGVGPDDRVVLWNGGVWDWLEPEPLIEAVALLGPAMPDLKLVFMGVKSPDAGLDESGALTRCRELVAARGLGGQVIFNDWVAYEQRADFLLEAQVGACLYPPGVETEYSFRTRLLDCLWAGLPILCSPGDALSRLVADDDLGAVVRDHEPGTVAKALEDLLTDPGQAAERRARCRDLAARLAWSRVAAPLVEFCAVPRLAPDKMGRFPLRPKARVPAGYFVRRGLEHLKKGTIFAAVGRFVRRKVKGP